MLEMMRCQTCGGTLAFDDSFKSAVCQHCHNQYFFKEEKKDELVVQLNIASKYLIASDFDSAITHYSALFEQYPNDAEIAWGLAISKYGIVFVKDDKTGKLIPTCSRTLSTSILKDEAYLSAIENAHEQQRVQYEQTAAIIDRLQKRIKRMMEDEEEYDVFISFKSEDENGLATEDSVTARMIYDELTKRGIKTFFSAVTLENRVGDEYEPIIYKALYSCKMFVLVATKEQYLNAVWVKNEWTRYRDRMEAEGKGIACPVYRGADVLRAMPNRFKAQQGIDLHKHTLDYAIVIADNAERVLGIAQKRRDEKEERERQIAEERQRAAQEELKRSLEEQQRAIEEKLKSIQNASQPTNESGSMLSSLIMRGKQEAENRSYTKAKEYFNKAVDLNPTSAEAWLGLHLANMGVADKSQIYPKVQVSDTVNSFTNAYNANVDLKNSYNKVEYKNAIKYATLDLKNELTEHANAQVKRMETANSELLKNANRCASKLLQANNQKQALELYNFVISKSVTDYEANLGLYLISRKVSQLENVRASLASYIDCVSSLDFNKTLVKSVEENRNLMTAIMSAGTEDKANLEAYVQKVKIEAEAFKKTAIERLPIMGMELLNKGNFADAFNCFNKANELSGGRSAEAYWGLTLYTIKKSENQYFKSEGASFVPVTSVDYYKKACELAGPVLSARLKEAKEYEESVQSRNQSSIQGLELDIAFDERANEENYEKATRFAKKIEKKRKRGFAISILFLIALMITQVFLLVYSFAGDFERETITYRCDTSINVVGHGYKTTSVLSGTEYFVTYISIFAVVALVFILIKALATAGLNSNEKNLKIQNEAIISLRDRISFKTQELNALYKSCKQNQSKPMPSISPVTAKGVDTYSNYAVVLYTAILAIIGSLVFLTHVGAAIGASIIAYLIFIRIVNSSARFEYDRIHKGIKALTSVYITLFVITVWLNLFSFGCFSYVNFEEVGLASITENYYSRILFFLIWGIIALNIMHHMSATKENRVHPYFYGFPLFLLAIYVMVAIPWDAAGIGLFHYIFLSIPVCVIGIGLFFLSNAVAEKSNSKSKSKKSKNKK